MSVIIRRGTGYMERPAYHKSSIGDIRIFSRDPQPERIYRHARARSRRRTSVGRASAALGAGAGELGPQNHAPDNLAL